MLFKPHIWLNSVLDIDKDFLEKHGIEALVLDLDNTLSMHGHQEPEKGVMRWLEQMRELGIKMTVVSNNTVKRVRPLAQKLGLQFCANGCKPLTFGISRAIRAMGADKRHTAVVGDQIFTDIVGGNLKGVTTVLVEPFHLEDTWTFRLKRRAESIFFKRDYSKLERKK